MADNNFPDDNNDGLDGIVPGWFDFNNNNNHGNTPPQSPDILDPLINMDDINEIPRVLEGWRNDIGWPQYQSQPNDRNEFPITGEPAQQTMPIVVTKVNEVEDRIIAVEAELAQKATHFDITITRNAIRNLNDTIIANTDTYNDNLIVLENIQLDHDGLKVDHDKLQDEYDYFVYQHAKEMVEIKKSRRTLNAMLIKMGRKIARLEAEKASTSRARKKRKTKKN